MYCIFLHEKDRCKKGFSSKIWKVLRCGLYLFLMFFGTIPHIKTASASDEEVEAARERVEQAEEKARNLEEAKEQFAHYLEEMSDQVDELTEELSDLSARQAELQDELEVTAKELLEAKETESNQYEAMKKRIQYMYEQGDTGFIEFVFSGESISSILNKAEYVMELGEYDRKMLIDYQTTKELVEKKEQELRTAKADLDQIITVTEEKQNEVLIAVAETTEKMELCAGELEDAKEELASYRAELQRKEQEAEERMARLAEEARRKEEERQIAGMGSSAVMPGGVSQLTGSSDAAGISSGSSGTANQPLESSESETLDYSVYSDVELLAAMIYREANVEPWKGKVAVGNVVMNRINSSRYPNTMLGVLSQPYQFSPWDGPKYRQVLQNGVTGDCRRAAEVAMSGSENYIGDLLHFRTYKPGWSGIIIGTHVFY